MHALSFVKKTTLASGLFSLPFSWVMEAWKERRLSGSVSVCMFYLVGFSNGNALPYLLYHKLNARCLAVLSSWVSPRTPRGGSLGVAQSHGNGNGNGYRLPEQAATEGRRSDPNGRPEVATLQGSIYPSDHVQRSLSLPMDMIRLQGNGYGNGYHRKRDPHRGLSWLERSPRSGTDNLTRC